MYTHIHRDLFAPMRAPALTQCFCLRCASLSRVMAASSQCKLEGASSDLQPSAYLCTQVLVSQRDGDAAAGELLEVLGFEHVAEVTCIVGVRPVRTPLSTLRLPSVAACGRCVHPRHTHEASRAVLPVTCAVFCASDAAMPCATSPRPAL